MTEQELATHLLHVATELKKLRVSISILQAALVRQVCGSDRDRAASFLGILQELEQEMLKADPAIRESELVIRVLKAWPPGSA